MQSHADWSKSIGAQNTELQNLEKYYEEKYNNSPEYQLLSGYNWAVEKGDISPLVGFDEYERVNRMIQENIVGIKTPTQITVESFATHFIDRVIGQTSTAHPGMRCGVSIDMVVKALENPVEMGEIRTMDDGDVRQTFYGSKVAVTVSIRDKKLIQVNPYRGG